MRADRLLSLLLLLQNRGRMTAQQLAEELEVSVRTVYRDVEALSASGVPVVAEAGHFGGYRLLDGYRTRLTGLTAEEAQAAFLAALPGPAAELGLGAALAAAQLKLRAALPDPLREQADAIRERFLLDAPGWYDDRAEALPQLPAVAAAVWERRVLDVRYRRWKAPEEVDRRLEPHGLVLKAGRWYLVARCEGSLRTYRVDQILALRPLDETFTPGPDFDLAAHWRAHLADFHARRHTAEAVLRLSPRGVARARTHLDAAVSAAVATTGTPAPDGWTVATIPIESVDHAHDSLLVLGADAEVLSPPALRARLTETVRALAERYRPEGEAGPGVASWTADLG
ncbi:helix-turn-helix transcriptional regulator [Streptacidiphilus jiangxiensis]|uniref:Predicted DNA-binding transcriptional regulator YafY, contains an HTH and WYL domains n=1 Tax=Streptacidiphilus jiangxiensis TaxID=235985 RepID=A0A1H7JYT2_STRJI|nr:WYL domain-containing protein [Streptacidiphilus jiangxiensis]SEK78917.1 Predicted DNA-binding transcriptional regulator YafY, contains an HTH and WYL domains [Streptacidiphilus jiangxiensis]